jgi:hypothetical protein
VLDYFQSGRTPDKGMPAIAARNQIRTDLQLSPFVLYDNSGDPVAVSHQAGSFVLHEKLKGREPPGVASEKLQEIPLRHESHEFAARRHMAEIGDIEFGISDYQPNGLHLPVRQLQEILQEPEFFEHFQSRRVYRVAAKIAEEILMLFEHRNLDPLTCQKVSK